MATLFSMETQMKIRYIAPSTIAAVEAVSQRGNASE